MCLGQKFLRAARVSRILWRNLPKVYYNLAENIQSIPRASASPGHQHLWCQDQWVSCNSRSYWQTFCHSRQHKMVVLQQSQISAVTRTRHRSNSRGDQDANFDPWLGSTLQHRSAMKRPKQLPDEAYVSQRNKKWWWWWWLWWWWRWWWQGQHWIFIGQQSLMIYRYLYEHYNEHYWLL